MNYLLNSFHFRLVLTLVPFALATQSFAQIKPNVLSATSACTSSERWYLLERSVPTWAAEFSTGVRTSGRIFQQHSRASVKLAKAKTDVERALAKYWQARAYFNGGLGHIAHHLFDQLILQYVENPALTGIVAAAMECQYRIGSVSPSLSIQTALYTKGISKLPPNYHQTYQHTELFKEVLLQATKTVLSQGKESLAAAESLGRLIHPKSPHDFYARGLIALQKQDYPNAVSELKKLNRIYKKYPFFENRRNEIFMLMGHAFYSAHAFPTAIKMYKRVETSYQNFDQALLGIAWSYLWMEKYSEAIGIASGFYAGVMKNSFAPEAPLIIGIGFNETCQFNEANKFIKSFKKLYKGSYKWMKQSQNKLDEGQNIDFYQVSIDFLKEKRKLPPKVGPTLIRPAAFKAYQNEVNMLVDEETTLKRALEETREIQKEAKFALKNNDMEYFTTYGFKETGDKKKKEQYFFQFLQDYYGELGNLQKSFESVKSRLIAKINLEMKRALLRNLKTLDFSVDNLQLLEVEIFNQTSDDVIWSNINSDFKEYAKGIKAGRPTPSKPSLDWGDKDTVTDETREVWEDEWTSSFASVKNLCVAKKEFESKKSGK